MAKFQHSLHVHPYGSVGFGAAKKKAPVEDEESYSEEEAESGGSKGGANAEAWSKVIEAGAGLATKGVMSYVGSKSEEKRRKSDLAYQKKMAAIEGKKSAAQAKLYEAQAKLAAAQKPVEKDTPPWVWAVAGVGGLAVIGVIVLAARK